MASSITEKLTSLGLFAPRVDRGEEAVLYLQRARLAAREERYEDALVFCEKAREADPENLSVLYCMARIHDVGTQDRDAAIRLYQRVIARAGYDGANPYCAAARDALLTLGSGGKDHG